MAVGDLKPDQCEGGLVENVEDPEQGGGEASGVRIFLFKAFRPVDVDLRSKYVGGYPPHGTGPGGFPNTRWHGD